MIIFKLFLKITYLFGGNLIFCKRDQFSTKMKYPANYTGEYFRYSFKASIEFMAVLTGAGFRANNYDVLK